MASTITPAAPEAAARLRQAAVADRFAPPLQARTVTPTLPIAALSAWLTIANSGAARVIGTYQTFLPDSDFAFGMAGPGGLYDVVRCENLATAAWACATPD